MWPRDAGAERHLHGHDRAVITEPPRVGGDGGVQLVGLQDPRPAHSEQRRRGCTWASGFGSTTIFMIATRTAAALANAIGPITINRSGPSNETFDGTVVTVGSYRIERTSALVSSLKKRGTRWITSSSLRLPSRRTRPVRPD